MKKMICLICILSFLFVTGCRAGEVDQAVQPSMPALSPFPGRASELPVVSPDPAVPSIEDMSIDDIYGTYGDPDALLKFACHISDSSDRGALFRREFTALVKGVKESESKHMITVSVDKVELTNATGDPADEPYFTNDFEFTEDVDIPEYNILILVNPGNHYQAITVEGLRAVIENREYEVPYHFYSVNGEIKVVMEMYLP